MNIFKKIKTKRPEKALACFYDAFTFSGRFFKL